MKSFSVKSNFTHMATYFKLKFYTFRVYCIVTPAKNQYYFLSVKK